MPRNRQDWIGLACVMVGLVIMGLVLGWGGDANRP